MSATPPRPYRAVCFDMGDTLLRVAPSYEAVYHRIFQRNGHDLPIEAVKAAVDSSWDRVMRQDHAYNVRTTQEATLAWQRQLEVTVMTALGIDPTHHDGLFMQIVAAFDNPASYALFPDALPTLERVRAAGYKTAVISNWSWGLPDLCVALGLSGYFDVITTSARTGANKPNPAIFTQTLDALGVAPHEAIHVGDMVYADVRGAWAVGMAALWLDRPKTEVDNFDASADIRRSDSPAVAAVTIHSLDALWPFLQHGAPVPE